MMYFDVGVGILLVACFLCLYRIAAGPTAPDRTVAIDILGTLIVGFTCLYALFGHHGAGQQEFYMNIALAWALLSFIGTVALAKHLEGRKFHE